MTLRQKQSLFMLNVGKLILFAYEHGYELTGGELMRTHNQQLLYFEGYKLKKFDGKLKLLKTKILSKTMFSKHLSKIAIDLNVFKDGKYITSKADVQFLGDYWESLNDRNKWGGNWNFVDTPHFQFS